jgi:hypothetical protein
MAMQALAPGLIWLLAIFLGLAVGAGLYESRVVVPVWAATPPRSWVNTGAAFWVYVTSGPLTVILLASLVVVWGYRGAPRPWWMAALALAAVERAATFGYFIPTMLRLQRQPAGPEASATLRVWARLDYVRHALSFAAWMMALTALSLLSACHAA